MSEYPFLKQYKVQPKHVHVVILPASRSETQLQSGRCRTEEVGTVFPLCLLLVGMVVGSVPPRTYGCFSQPSVKLCLHRKGCCVCKEEKVGPLSNLALAWRGENCSARAACELSLMPEPSAGGPEWQVWCGRVSLLHSG